MRFSDAYPGWLDVQCPTCDGAGSYYIVGAAGRIVGGHESPPEGEHEWVNRCETCNGTGSISEPEIGEEEDGELR